MKHLTANAPYATNALEPVISQATIELHSLQTPECLYVTNLNNLIPGTEFENMSLVDIARKSDGGIFNNAGQTLNHNLYFTQFSPTATTTPSGRPAGAY